jgi:GrpB-like predicted nucleotidyltransferase (UPF0157 family)
MSMQPIEIVDYSTDWPIQFEEIASAIRIAFAGGPTIEIEHVGSTAVPGLAAKPILDIDVVIRSHSDLADAIKCLGTIGYMHQGDLGVVGREAFSWPPHGRRHHLYVCSIDNEAHKRHIAFRDYLRNHVSDAEQYAKLKRDLAVRYRSDRVAYTNGKLDFVNSILAKTEW